MKGYHRLGTRGVACVLGAPGALLPLLKEIRRGGEDGMEVEGDGMEVKGGGGGGG